MFKTVLEALGVSKRQSSDRVVMIAQRALKSPGSISLPDIKSLAASVLSQARPGPRA